MARRRVIWHIGPADPGTDFLAPALRVRSEDLAEHGIAVPTGPWHEVENRIWKHKGTSLLSTPGLAGAPREKIDLRLTGLRDLEVHLVLLVRDLPTQVYAAWQATLQHGSTTPLQRYADRVMDPERNHWQAEDFWAGHDLESVLARWTRAFRADRVHVVPCPADADALWDRLLGVAGVAGVSRPHGFVVPSRSAPLDPERVLDVTTGWAKAIADRGFDLAGSLIGCSATAAPAAGGPEDRLAAATDLLRASTAEIERLHRTIEDLRAENADLDRKRRKHKRRLALVTDQPSAG